MVVVVRFVFATGWPVCLFLLSDAGARSLAGCSFKVLEGMEIWAGPLHPTCWDAGAKIVFSEAAEIR